MSCLRRSEASGGRSGFDPRPGSGFHCPTHYSFFFHRLSRIKGPRKNRGLILKKPRREQETYTELQNLCEDRSSGCKSVSDFLHENLKLILMFMHFVLCFTSHAIDWICSVKVYCCDKVISDKC